MLCSGQCARIDPVTVGELHAVVVAVIARDKDAGRAAGQRFTGKSGAIQCVDCDFKKDAMLRVHAFRFATHDAEERRVELIDILNEPAVARRQFAGRRRIVIVKCLQIPTRRRDRAYGVDTIAQQRPEFLR